MLEKVAKDNKNIALRVAGESSGKEGGVGLFDFKAK